ncbi:GAF and PAS/PAC sensor-containing adenylate/guanylate cyclase [Nitzschia inconspicua]|uniref:GAF and PAS/PAC sensor-containing adenylate/guanylate cyclase n=1 Tax=Nitzschia inconspicua TaxID=303405 RepID=A0A9K3KE08_9STRA|nr:GAF and PAS/PAC sensor-containing adenylate/guanylate cyclase [Nitzschia inconspicua]
MMTVHLRTVPNGNDLPREKNIELTQDPPNSQDEEFGVVRDRRTIVPSSFVPGNVALGFVGHVDDEEYNEDILDHATNSSRTLTTEANLDTKSAPKHLRNLQLESENKAVCRFKWLVVILILLVTIFTSAFMYLMISRTEEEEFQQAFTTQAMAANMAWKNNLERQFEAMSSISSAITLFTSQTNSNDDSMFWPWSGMNVSVTSKLGSVLEGYTDSYFVASFFFSDENAENWESYSSKIINMSSHDVLSAEESDFFVSGSLSREDTDQLQMKPVNLAFAAKLHSFPFDRPPSSFNLTNDAKFQLDVTSLLISQKVVLGSTLITSSDILIPVLYPIVSSRIDQDAPFGGVVGMVGGVTSWNRILSLPKMTETTSLIVVVKDIKECIASESEHSVFSILLEGDSSVGHAGAITYLGTGDWHDPQYDTMGLYFELSEGLDYRGTLLLKSSSSSPQSCNSTSPRIPSYRLFVYPTSKLHGNSKAGRSLFYPMVALGVGIVILLAFGFFDWHMRRQYALVSQQAIQSQEIITSMFPASIHERLLKSKTVPGILRESTHKILKRRDPSVQGTGNLSTLESSHNSFSFNLTGEENFATFGTDRDNDNVQKQATAASHRSFRSEPPIHRLRLFLTHDLPISTNHSTMSQSETMHRMTSQLSLNDEPIADLFPECTVIFADIAGFTAWSSVREPVQVFRLLETLYTNFDKIAKKRSVFKVETVGDCYIAVTGLPEAQPNHAVIMSKFAKESMQRMSELVKKLEVTLGPDTGELCLRCGLHSGPITAGVLRGEKSRFQLFGDTVNFASQMEATGLPNKIQCAQATADLLIAAGKQHWVVPRDGLHEPQFWQDDDDNIDVEGDYDGFEDVSRKERLVEWNVEILGDLLRQIVAHRQTNKAIISDHGEDFVVLYKDGQSALDEISEIISLGGGPVHQHLGASSYWNIDPTTVVLPKGVEKQLKDYVSMIACMYRDNPFHNFEHASHVLNSVQKLLKRVILAEQERVDSATSDSYATNIASDPLTQFSIVFSALIHDVDHSGVPNGQLIKEEAHVATLYNNKSVAEQNSLDLAFELLMDPRYEDLQRCIFCSREELHRFRQLLVNVVIATDIFDKDMRELRSKRWGKAFHQENVASLSQVDEFNLKGTIVLEHIMQASDVSHTMQHWHIYKKWNQRLFEEMYTAFVSGRGDQDPSEGWYKGELWFFDNYVIPLAKKLKECTVFGAASDECLNYAISNRKEWEEKGEEVVAQFTACMKSEKNK